MRDRAAEGALGEAEGEGGEEEAPADSHEVGEEEALIITFNASRQLAPDVTMHRIQVNAPA